MTITINIISKKAHSVTYIHFRQIADYGTRKQTLNVTKCSEKGGQEKDNKREVSLEMWWLSTSRFANQTQISGHDLPLADIG